MGRRACALGCLLLAGCPKEAPPAAPVSNAEPRVLKIPDWFPSRLPIADYLGAAACAECHPSQTAAWKGSAHGRATQRVAERAPLGRFDGRRQRVGDGWVTPYQDGQRFMMRIEPERAGAKPEEAQVALALGSGRQHQVYFTERADHAYKMLPLIWVRLQQTWIESALYVDGATDPNSEHYFGRADLADGCMACHLSQARFARGPSGFELAYQDLSINCESCHGPGKEHVRRRRDHLQEEDPYLDLHALPKQQDTAICAQCHALKSHLFLGLDGDGLPYTPIFTAAAPAFRPDGTQRSTGYQTVAHTLSRCFSVGAASCSTCHAPHPLSPRSLSGESASGANAEAQCTVCHRNLIDPKAGLQHHHHPAGKVTCIDCHMSKAFIFDDPKTMQRVADHSISIPHPKESLELGLPNACNTCHADRKPEWLLEALQKWGAKQALESRPWVVALDAAKKSAFRSQQKLAAVMTSTRSSGMVQASVLELLGQLPPWGPMIGLITPFLKSGDPETRALAYAALIAQDPKNRPSWRDHAFRDASPLVRAQMLLIDPEVPERAAFDQALEDTLLLSWAPPRAALRHIAALCRRQHDEDRARAVLELIGRLDEPK